MADECRNIPESSPDRAISLVRSYCDAYDQLSIEARNLGWPEKLKKLDEMAGILNRIREVQKNRNTSPALDSNMNDARIELQNNPFPFRILGGKNGSYNYIRQEVRPNGINTWDMTVSFQKFVTNAHIPVEMHTRFEIINDPQTGIITLWYAGRQYSLVAPRHSEYISIQNNPRWKNISRESKEGIIKIGDIELKIEFNI